MIRVEIQVYSCKMNPQAVDKKMIFATQWSSRHTNAITLFHLKLKLISLLSVTFPIRFLGKMKLTILLTAASERLSCDVFSYMKTIVVLNT